MAIKISKNRLDIDGKPLENADHVDLNQISTPNAPPAVKSRLYSKTDGKLYIRTSTIGETAVGGGGLLNVWAFSVGSPF